MATTISASPCAITSGLLACISMNTAQLATPQTASFAEGSSSSPPPARRNGQRNRISSEVVCIQSRPRQSTRFTAMGTGPMLFSCISAVGSGNNTLTTAVCSAKPTTMAATILTHSRLSKGLPAPRTRSRTDVLQIFFDRTASRTNVRTKPRSGQSVPGSQLQTPSIVQSSTTLWNIHWAKDRATRPAKKNPTQRPVGASLGAQLDLLAVLSFGMANSLFGLCGAPGGNPASAACGNAPSASGEAGRARVSFILQKTQYNRRAADTAEELSISPSSAHPRHHASPAGRYT